jgi:hypothetical protein
MRRFLTLFVVAAVLAVPALGHGRHGGTSVSIDDGDGPTDCSDLRVRFDGERASVMTEEVAAAAGARSLRVKSAHNGGIRVSGWSGRGYSVQACKAVGNGLNPADIRVSFNGSELTADGPANGQWVVYFLVRAPRGADLALEATNGPITIDGVDGTVNARVTNGPVSLKESTGRIDVTATNGPISISGGSGDVKARATNGPVSVKLQGSSWTGNLDASTQNGPVSIHVPRNYNSGVSVEARGHGPISCKADDCRSVSRFDEDGDEPRRIQLGNGPTTVRVATVNGPLSIRNE